MIGALKQLEAGRKAEDVGRGVGVSKHTIYAWKAKYGGMEVTKCRFPLAPFSEGYHRHCRSPEARRNASPWLSE
jgi:hypothetical protein